MRTTLFSAVLGAAALAAASASAYEISPSTYGACLGQASCTIGGATLTALPTGGTFVEQNYRGGQGLGVRFVQTGGANEPEINVGEQIKIVFDSPTIVSTIKIIFLYNPAEFGPSGDPIETAALLTSSGTTYSLTSTDNSASGFSWGGLGTAVRDSTNLGLFTISNPFDGAITELTFSAVGAANPASGDVPDYAINLVVAVPEPATLGLLGAGLLGLGALARRRHG